jgi:hypothetical protein
MGWNEGRFLMAANRPSSSIYFPLAVVWTMVSIPWLVTGCAKGISAPITTDEVLITAGLTLDYGREEPCFSAYELGTKDPNFWDPCDEEGLYPVSYPSVLVNLSPFAIDRHEVSNLQYRYCEAMGECSPPPYTDSPDQGDDYYFNEQYDAYPVNTVTWEQASDYCQSVGKRLPTDMEWERVASGNAMEQPKRAFPLENFSSLDDCSPTLDVAVKYCTGIEKYAPVDAPGDDFVYEGDEKIYHLFGNVAEWVEDWYQADFTCAGPLPDGCVPCASCPTNCAVGSLPNPCLECQNNCKLCDKCAPQGSNYCFYACQDKPREYPVCIAYTPLQEPLDPMVLLETQVGNRKIFRGGNVMISNDETCMLRTDHRALQNTDEYNHTYKGRGFRCARDLTEEELANIDLSNSYRDRNRQPNIADGGTTDPADTSSDANTDTGPAPQEDIDEPDSATSCDDGAMNGDETDVDCGGICDACPTCDDGAMNGDETGVDCGGSCSACLIVPACNDGTQNGDETGVDCGGSCDACVAAPTCNDGTQNGDEEDVDCGGVCDACVVVVTCDGYSASEAAIDEVAGTCATGGEACDSVTLCTATTQTCDGYVAVADAVEETMGACSEDGAACSEASSCTDTPPTCDGYVAEVVEVAEVMGACSDDVDSECAAAAACAGIDATCDGYVAAVTAVTEVMGACSENPSTECDAADDCDGTDATCDDYVAPVTAVEEVKGTCSTDANECTDDSGCPDIENACDAHEAAVAEVAEVMGACSDDSSGCASQADCEEVADTCADGEQNGDEEGVDCGGSCTNPC